MVTDSKIVCIVPARSGSKSIKHKNIIKLKSHPLFMYSIAAAKLSKKIDQIIFSTDDIEYKNIAESYGLEVPFLRPDSFSTDLSTDRDFLLHAMDWYKINYGDCPEYWVHLRPTTPLRDPNLIDEAINKILKDTDATSLRSAHQAPESPLKWFKMSSDKKYFFGFNENDEKLEEFNKPKELFEDIYIPNGYVDVVRASYMTKNHDIHGKKMIAFQTPSCTEVDSIAEMNYLMYQMNEEGSYLHDYLCELNK